MRKWTNDLDMTTIPDEVLKSEWASRCARKRKSYTGGIIWAKHNAKHPGCRCAKCIAKRAKAQKEVTA
jgi:hypothetical protein